MGPDLNWTQRHPVSHVRWVPTAHIFANAWNPNVVAPPELKLLELSITEDGFTQPIVVWSVRDDYFEVVDGYHRFLVGSTLLKLDHLPVVAINQDRAGKTDRMAATIRHNRARGKHQVQAMSQIVQELVRRGWNDEKISKQLGMERDEVVRLKQVGGLAALFANEKFSEAWELVEDD